MVDMAFNNLSDLKWMNKPPLLATYCHWEDNLIWPKTTLITHSNDKRTFDVIWAEIRFVTH
jgi:hypothetical protein